MSGKGVKRASPGASTEKNPLGDVELTDEDAAKLNDIQKEIARTELLLERRAQEALYPVYEKRRAILKGINKFWPVALMNNSMFALHAQHNSDQVALSYLEDVWVSRDTKESRCFTLEFYFKENPYFSDSVLKKEYKWSPGPAAAEEKPDADGLTGSMIDFSWERDVEPQATKINWKDDSKNLTKLHPRVTDEEGDDMPAEAGSFFNLFEDAEDPFDLGVLIANDVFPEATDYFLGRAGGEGIDSDDEEDSEDEEDEEEIDLEKPRPKKQKQA
ncbi:uncharacterized protein C8Q71DRAFT_908227 [Rhodofomes roseus]|uniref:Uncharacterized protein n=1 Tax=Rhodofomes roseus TaxID=34475 RepID=A0A4Y9XVC8_9APHY|nr:uncharacterized protein C8Q71DRAFT_908227 [Rhodofomes roseus]KAH9835830.1 hypothetical protein C8Q71DRAFT_908227 [Rhodofomes roseus]TFY53111.1 hypothetical protein EVJ58_g9633 [Rhodofomes roseus]